MRLLFLLLVLVNVAFYAYAFMARQQDSAQNRISQLQINPDKVRLLQSAGGARDAAPQKPAPAAADNTTAAPAACIEWGLFAGPDVARADAAITGLGLPQDSVQRTVVGAGGYWVYLPPLKTKAEVGRKIDELKTFGVTDLFVVQDPAPLRNAISLGIFKTEEGAQKFLEGLRGKGVRSAVAARRENFLRQVAYFVREPTEAVVASLTERQREFPGSEIKAVACPANDAAK
ncbi:MAG: hypothetical protein AABZ67_15755 [Pseudomonadota bacterium]